MDRYHSAKSVRKDTCFVGVDSVSNRVRVGTSGGPADLAISGNFIVVGAPPPLYVENFRNTSASSASTTVVSYLTTPSLAVGTWLVSFTGSYGVTASTNICTVSLRNNGAATDIATK